MKITRYITFLIVKGEDYNAPVELENGPLDNRSCTDVLCCLLFVAFLAAMLSCGIYGYFTGQPGKLLAPVDSDGKS